MEFVHETLGQRTTFATSGALAAVTAEVVELGTSRPMVIADDEQAGLAGLVARQFFGARLHDEVVMHVPADVAERARDAAADSRADVLVSIGGGSTTGLAKAVALTTGLPIIAVPTTYAGSEATNVWGVTTDGTKTTGVDPRVLPRSIVYDASLLTTLPREVAAASGLNAMAHCVDAMWGPRVDPIDQALALEGIRALTAGLPAVVADPTGTDGIEQSLLGAYLAAVSFASAGSAMHHKICHVLGGMFNLPHAETHAVVLPHVLAFNAPRAPEVARRLAAALDAPTAVEGVVALARALGTPASLRDIGMPEEGLARAVAPILKAIPADNPAPVDADNLAALLRAAWEGRLP